MKFLGSVVLDALVCTVILLALWAALVIVPRQREAAEACIASGGVPTKVAPTGGYVLCAAPTKP